MTDIVRINLKRPIIVTVTAYDGRKDERKVDAIEGEHMPREDGEAGVSLKVYRAFRSQGEMVSSFLVGDPVATYETLERDTPKPVEHNGVSRQSWRDTVRTAYEAPANWPGVAIMITASNVEAITEMP